MKSAVKVSDRYITQLGILSTCVDCQGGRREIKVDRALEGQPALTDIPSSFYRVERKFYAPYCMHKVLKVQVCPQTPFAGGTTRQSKSMKRPC